MRSCRGEETCESSDTRFASHPEWLLTRSEPLFLQVRKIDWHIMPILFMCYAFYYMSVPSSVDFTGLGMLESDRWFLCPDPSATRRRSRTLPSTASRRTSTSARPTTARSDPSSTSDGECILST